VVVKGDLTTRGRPEEYQAFLDCYRPAFGDRLVHVRGNHDCYEHQAYAADPFQEVAVPGAVVAVLDTGRPGFTNGTLHKAQLEQLDELGARAEVPVLVMGHHPIWDARYEQRTETVFSLLPEATEALLGVFARRPRLVTYAAGHTHRNHLVEIDGAAFVEVGALKDFPGAWCEYQVFDGGVLQVVRRVSHPDAVAWTEKTRAMFGGAYGLFALGALEERCRLLPLRR
jgi:predicted phosphodiesterase